MYQNGNYVLNVSRADNWKEIETSVKIYKEYKIYILSIFFILIIDLWIFPKFSLIYFIVWVLALNFFEIKVN